MSYVLDHKGEFFPPKMKHEMPHPDSETHANSDGTKTKSNRDEQHLW